MEKNRFDFRCIFKYLFPLAILLVASFWFFENNIAPKIIEDEYGYLAAGAFFGGKDWNDVTSFTPYYGIGYGLLLSIFIRFFKSAILMYRLAILLNFIFVFGIYQIVLSIISNVRKNDEAHIEDYLVAFLCALIPQNIFYSYFTLSEVFLCFLYWLVIFWGVRYIEKKKTVFAILFIVTNSFLLYVHLRTVGTVIVGIFFLLCEILFFEKSSRKEKIKKILICVSLIGILFIVFYFLKRYFQSMTQNVFAVTSDVNDIENQTERVKGLISLEGIYSFLKLLLGRAFDVIASSYGMAAIPVFCLISVIFVKKDLSDPLDRIALFSFMGMMAQMCVSAVFCIGGENGRFDLLTYNRYHGYTEGVMTLMGFIYVFKTINESHFAKLRGFIILEIIIVKITTLLQNINGAYSHTFYTTPQLALYVFLSDNKYLGIVSYGFIAIIFLIFFMFFMNRPKIQLCLFASFVIIMNIIGSIYSYNNLVASWSVSQTENSLKVVKYLEDNSFENNTVFLCDDTSYQMDQIQFFLWDNKIRVVRPQDEIEGAIICTKQYDEHTLLQKGYFKCYANDAYKVFKKKQKK